MGETMYNQYLNEARAREPEQPLAAPSAGLLDGLGRRLGEFRLDADTLVLLAVLWFILREGEEEADTELLAALAVLLVVGL